jgi:polyisoprenoid-binding protein YceI
MQDAHRTDLAVHGRSSEGQRSRSEVELVSMQASPASTPQLTPHALRLDTLRTRLAFNVRHLMGRVRGVFTRVAGVVHYDPQKPENTAVRVTIQSSSVVTHNAARDARVRSSGFLNVRAFPEITFVSTTARRCRRRLEVTGDLTIHGISRPVTLTVSRLRKSAARSGAPEGRGSGISLVARARLNRSEFGVGPNSELELGGLMIGDEIAVEMDVELVRE